MKRGSNCSPGGSQIVRREGCAARDLPASVRGPVENCALARLAVLLGPVSPAGQDIRTAAKKWSVGKEVKRVGGLGGGNFRALSPAVCAGPKMGTSD